MTLAQHDGVYENPFGENQPCFGCSPTHPIGFRLQFTRDEEWIRTSLTPHDRYEGPPGIMHGGLVATLADEVAAWAVVALKEKFGFTAEFKGRLKGPIRTGKLVSARARITDDGRRLVKVEVFLAQEGVDLFEGNFSFVLVDRAGAEKLIGSVPPAWEKFMRD